VTVTYFFKLFDNLSSETEVDFAELEIEGLFSQCERIKNVVQFLMNPPFCYFTSHDSEVMNLLTWHLASGGVHGFFCQGELRDISNLVARLAYTKEIYVCLSEVAPVHSLLKVLYPNGRLGVDVSVFTANGSASNWTLFRIITRTFFLEQMKNVTFLSVAKTKRRQVERLNENVDRLISYAHNGYRLYPLFPDSPAFKEIEDFFETRTEIKLYLTHAWGAPYKGKFHPRMAKALINATCDNGLVLDPFVGSGTTAIEATLMGMDTIGTEINPFCAKTASAKISGMHTNPERLEEWATHVVTLAKREGSLDLSFGERGAQASTAQLQAYERKRAEVDAIERIKHSLLECRDEAHHNILYAALGKVISETIRAKRRVNPLELFDQRCWEMVKTLYAFRTLRNRIWLNLGSGKIYACDAKHLPMADECVDSIVTSPSYSTAIDYVKNDKAQLVILENMDLLKLNDVLIGSPRAPSVQKHAFSLWFKTGFKDTNRIPRAARQIIELMLEAGRVDLAARQYKYLVDMKGVLAEMRRVLKSDAKAAIIIGNNHFRVNNKEVEFENDDYLGELASENNFRLEHQLRRRLTKTMFGAIQSESILILRKH
jgi:tRNA G10  N-methylase Trm11